MGLYVAPILHAWYYYSPFKCKSPFSPFVSKLLSYRGQGEIGKRRDFGTQDIIVALEETVPLSSIAHQQIAGLKRWAAEAGARTASKDDGLLKELQDYQSSSGINPIQVD